MKRLIVFGIASMFAITLASCTQMGQDKQDKVTVDDKAVIEAAGPEITKAICVLYPTENSEVEGVVTFTKVPQGMLVIADVTGLTPGKHGFHIHEYGDCSALDAKSAGGHFNPYNKKHGGPFDAEHHAGDLGNLEADQDGNAHLELTVSDLGFEGINNIIGRGIIVHADPDDLVSQPTGNAGGRVACGSIGVAK